MSVFGTQDAVKSFLYACAIGDVQLVSDRIRTGFFIDAEDDIGNTSLQIAAAAGHVQVMELLLRTGASVNKSNCYGWTALHQAACAGHLRIVQMLVQHDASVTAKTKYNQSVLSLAAFSGHVKIVNYLLSLDVNWLTVETSSKTDIIGFPGLSAFLTCCAFGKEDVLSALLEFGYNVNEKCNLTGTSALMLAAGSGHVDCCQVLVENGADMKAIDCAGKSASAYAAMLGYKVQLLMATSHMTGENDNNGTYLDPNDAYLFEEDDVNVTDVFDALRADDLELLGRILTASPSLKNKETLDGNRTLLIEAASSRHSRALKLLLSLGCTVNTTASSSGRTPLSHAVENCFDDGILHLLDAGADPTVKDLSGQSALDYMSHRLCDLGQVAIRRLCQAGLAEMAPNLGSVTDTAASNSSQTKVGNTPSSDALKTGTKTTLLSKLKAKFSSKSSKSHHGDDGWFCDLTLDLFSFPGVGPLSYSMGATGGGLLELDPVRVEPLTPPFDRRKLIWTDGAPDDSTTSGPPMTPSAKEDAGTVPGGTFFFNKGKAQSKKSARSHAEATNSDKASSDSNKRLPSGTKAKETSHHHRSSSVLSSGDESVDADDSDLRGLLRKMKLDQYASLLKNNEITDMKTFQLLTDRDLRDLNVTTLDRPSLIQAVTEAKSLSK